MEKTLENTVKEFHDKLEISATEELKSLDTKRDMKISSSHIDSMSKHFLQIYKHWCEQHKHVDNPPNRDTAYLRMHLILEEAAELMKAFAECDEIGVFDALCDLLYVTAGTAAAFDLPLSAGFKEVHRSNMTKEKQATDKDAIRVREKGPNYEPPRLDVILQEHRNSCKGQQQALEAVEVDRKEDQGE